MTVHNAKLWDENNSFPAVSTPWKKTEMEEHFVGLKKSLSEMVDLYVITAADIQNADVTKAPFDKKLCLHCDSPFSVRCKMYLDKLITLSGKNSKHLSRCGESIDGEWSSWKDEGSCDPAEMIIQNEYCGSGYQLQERNCQNRTFGGAWCKDEELEKEFDYRHVRCVGDPCPGKN